MPRARHRSPRQRTALGKEAFAEGTTLGKDRPTANKIFAEGLGPRQRYPRQSRSVGSRRPFPVKLCRGPPVRPSAKVRQIFFKSLPRAPDQALGKDFLKTSFRPNFFFINRLCRGPEARPSAKKTFAEGQDRPSAKSPQQFFSVRSFAEGPDPRPRQRFFIFIFKILCRGPQGQALGKEPSANFCFFVFLAQFFCGATIHCFELNFKI